jgi:hypothetical protein
MTITFKPLTIESKNEVSTQFDLSNTSSCEYNFNTLFLWNNLYKANYFIDKNYTVFLNQYREQYYTMMPLADEKYYEEAFNFIWDYFRRELGIKMQMYAVEEKFAEVIKEKYEDQFLVKEVRDNFDYIYDAEALRTLRGKKYHQKRNHINGFMREYDHQYTYRSITEEDLEEVMECLKQWQDDRSDNEKLQGEATGIQNFFKNQEALGFKAAGIWIADKLEAFTMGSYANQKQQAIIHVEKANTDIRGLYAVINQMFLNEDFPDVTTVNREDDLGIPGIRKAKLSYNPIDLVKKYTIIER